MLGLAGFTDIEDSKEVTVRARFPKTAPEAALMLVVAAAMAVARPLSLTVATEGFEELQVTRRVKS